MVERIKKGTVIITEGRIYALFHDRNSTTNEVCGRCELREQCESGIELHKLSDLCMANNVTGDAFFLECSSKTSKRLRDIAFQQDGFEVEIAQMQKLPQI